LGSTLIASQEIIHKIGRFNVLTGEFDDVKEPFNYYPNPVNSSDCGNGTNQNNSEETGSNETSSPKTQKKKSSDKSQEQSTQNKNDDESDNCNAVPANVSITIIEKNEVGDYIGKASEILK
jgi:hypothetical protein